MRRKMEVILADTTGSAVYSAEEKRVHAMKILGGRRTSGPVIYEGEEIRVGVVPGSGMLKPKVSMPGIETLCPFSVRAAS